MPQTTVVKLRGGPASGTEATVRLIAGTLPCYLGVAGGNYILDHESFGAPCYDWVPPSGAARSAASGATGMPSRGAQR